MKCSGSACHSASPLCPQRFCLYIYIYTYIYIYISLSSTFIFIPLGRPCQMSAARCSLSQPNRPQGTLRFKLSLLHRGQSADGTLSEYSLQFNHSIVWNKHFGRWISSTLQSPLATLRINRFNNQKLYFCPQGAFMKFCMRLRTNSDYFPTES
jgi:hypothetical protein